MKILFVGAIVLIAGSVAFFLPRTEAAKKGQGEPVDASHIVLTEKGFSPADVTVRKGGTITFTTTIDRPFWPASDLHPTHGIYSEFDPKRPVQADASWTFTFENTGAWNYHDHIRSYYTGTIYVVE